jgi:predicted transcriptional regulator
MEIEDTTISVEKAPVTKALKSLKNCGFIKKKKNCDYY